MAPPNTRTVCGASFRRRSWHDVPTASRCHGIPDESAERRADDGRADHHRGPRIESACHADRPDLTRGADADPDG